MLRPSRSLPRKPRPSNLVVDVATSVRLSKIRQHGTSAELKVRKYLHALGHRYRVRNRDLPGSPDIANRTRKWAVFVNGCFWHRHAGCSRTTTPTRNRQFWVDKFEANVRRDERVQSELRRLGFRVVVIWECECEDGTRLRRLRRALESVP
ncbi:MAG TPA: very short patch repair endonuclease [Thermoanaerobaculia bacterium]